MNYQGNESEHFFTRKPNNTALLPYISYYYFHASAKTETPIRYAYYPNYKNALSIYKNSKVIFSEHHSTSIPDPSVAYSMIYSGVQHKVRSAELIAPFKKIGIVFEATGIGEFMDVPLSAVSNDPIDKSFSFFGEELEHCCDQIHAEEDLERKIDLLDDFFLNRLSKNSDLLLRNCIEFMLTSSNKPTVNGLCDQFSVNRKTLLRLFQKQLCCSVKDYIHVVQFRKALNQYLLSNSEESLTELALNGDYYDQSQFIAHFKKLTGFNPRLFFKRIHRLGQEDTFWMFD